VRLIFAVAGVEFEDERLTKEEWETFKPKTPMKGMPVLTIKDKGVVGQSGAIARYLARKYKLFGSNPWEELLIDEVCESINDVVTDVMKWFFEQDEAKKAEISKSIGETTIPKFVDFLRLRMKDGQNGYIVGDKLSLADIAVFNIIDAMKSRGNTWFDTYDDVMAHYEKVKTNEGIAAWLGKRPAE